MAALYKGLRIQHAGSPLLNVAERLEHFESRRVIGFRCRLAGWIKVLLGLEGLQQLLDRFRIDLRQVSDLVGEAEELLRIPVRRGTSTTD